MVFSPMYPAWEITPGPFILMGDLIVESFFILDLILHLYKVGRVGSRDTHDPDLTFSLTFSPTFSLALSLASSLTLTPPLTSHPSLGSVRP